MCGWVYCPAQYVLTNKRSRGFAAALPQLALSAALALILEFAAAVNGLQQCCWPNALCVVIMEFITVCPLCSSVLLILARSL